MRIRTHAILGSIAAFLGVLRAEGALDSPERLAASSVIVVANGSARGSVEVARHYAAVRSVPDANVIGLPMPTGETITWPEFITTIWQPLEDKLVGTGWIDAIPMDLHDDIGRRRYAVSGHHIAAVVLCWGVPLRIADDPKLFKEVRPLTQHEEFRTNQGSVDSELSLLAQPGYPINAAVRNPLFGVENPDSLTLSRVVKVTRLDGPTPADAMALVDRAIEAERTGLLGRAYVDLAGPSEKGNQWLESTGNEIEAEGFDTTVGQGPSVLPDYCRFDAPALYFGWYTPDLTGPFELPGFRFPPGAIAVHIHSFSAHTLRSSTEGWCGPLVARGVTATLGNVFEPYLEYLHRPDLFMAALARGDDLADAAYYALPMLSWQSVVIGDPLYRPFAVSLDSQLADLKKLPPALAPYAVLRRMNLLDAAGSHREALAAGKEALKSYPGIVIAFAVAQRQVAAGDHEGAIWTVRDAADATDVSAQNWALFYEAARFLDKERRGAEAVAVMTKLLDADSIPKDARREWLSDARAIALRAGDSGQAAQWSEELGRLSGAAPKAPGP